jgi:phage shock protein A
MTDVPVLAQLREQLADLERDARTLVADIAREGAEASRWEQRAFDAVRRGNDGDARASLEQQAIHADRAAIGEHELALVREMQVACRDFLSAAGAADPGPPAAGAQSNEEL